MKFECFMDRYRRKRKTVRRHFCLWPRRLADTGGCVWLETVWRVDCVIHSNTLDIFGPEPYDYWEKRFYTDQFMAEEMGQVQ